MRNACNGAFLNASIAYSGMKLISFIETELTEQEPDAGKDWRQEEKGATEDEMVGWHRRLNESEQTPGVWRTGEPGVLQSTGSQRVGHDLATEQQQKYK